MPVTVTVTAKGQVTLRKEVLDHLGARPGDRLDVEFLPSGRIEARMRQGAPASSLFGLLKRPEERPRSIEDINESAAAGWSDQQ